MESASILRLFISLNPPPEIISGLRDQQTFLRTRLAEQYGKELPVRWTRPAQFHLTLLFLGNVNSQQAEWIRKANCGNRLCRKGVPDSQVERIWLFPSLSIAPCSMDRGAAGCPIAQAAGRPLDAVLTSSRPGSVEMLPIRTLLSAELPENIDSRAFRTSCRGTQQEPVHCRALRGRPLQSRLMQSRRGAHGVEYSCLAEFLAQRSSDRPDSTAA